MKKSTSIWLLVLSVVLVAAWTLTGFIDIPLGRYDHLAFTNPDAIVKGLDLSGGVYAIYKPAHDDEADLSTKLSSAMNVLRERLDNAGYTEATIGLQGVSQIRIEIPNLDKPEEVLNLIGEPALLEFVEPDGTVIFTGEHVQEAMAGVANGKNVVNFVLDEEGKRLFSEATARLIGQAITIRLDGETLSSPTVNTHIAGGEGYIEGSFTAGSAAQLANFIQSGALPLELEQIEVRTISATLGVEALDSSLLAALIGFIILLIFMVVVYRVPGLVADLAMIIYIMIVLTCVAEFKIQLTLPGIAGIILGIGMAVDANVIIYERIKEEMTLGKPIRTALANSYKKATVTILDANITTIIAAIVLAVVGAGSVKGFAYTLIISILASMFTALVVSRFLLKLLAGLNVSKPSLYGISKKRLANPERERRLPVMRSAKWLVCVSLAVMLVGFVVAGIWGFNFGIDFTGGTILTINTHADVDTNKVESVARDYISGDMQVAISDGTMAVIRYQDADEDAETQEEMREELLATLQETYPEAEIENLERVGAVAGDTLRNNAIQAIAIAAVLMLVYIWIRFQLLSGVAAIIVLLHDVLIMLAVMALTQTQINSHFVAAVLTIVGYSINNTIVIFDRIRDIRRTTRNMNRKEIAERAVGESIGRTVNTTLTTLITIICLYILGVDSIREFSLPIIVGLLAGFYSATFLSAPIWAWLNNWADNARTKRKQKKSQKGGKKPYTKAKSKA